MTDAQVKLVLDEAKEYADKFPEEDRQTARTAYAAGAGFGFSLASRPVLVKRTVAEEREETARLAAEAELKAEQAKHARQFEAMNPGMGLPGLKSF